MSEFTGLPLPDEATEERLELLDLRVCSAISEDDFPDWESVLLDPANDPKPRMRQQRQTRNDCQGQALCNGAEKRQLFVTGERTQYSDTYAYQGSEYRDRGGRVGADQGTSIAAGVELLVDGIPGLKEGGLPTETDWPYNSYTRSSSEFKRRAQAVEVVSGFVTQHYAAPPFREALIVMAAGGSIHWGTYWGLNWDRNRVVRKPPVRGRGGHATEVIWATKKFGEWALEVWNSHGDPGPFYVHENEYEYLRSRRNSPFGAFALLPDRPEERFLTYRQIREGFVV